MSGLWPAGDSKKAGTPVEVSAVAHSSGELAVKSLALAASILAASVVGASAADMAVKAPPLPVAVSNWTGWYAGGNFGYGFGENTNPGLSLVNNSGNIITFLTTGFPGFVSGNQFPNLSPDGVFGSGGKSIVDLASGLIRKAVVKPIIRRSRYYIKTRFKNENQISD